MGCSVGKDVNGCRVCAGCLEPSDPEKENEESSNENEEVDNTKDYETECVTIPADYISGTNATKPQILSLQYQFFLMCPFFEIMNACDRPFGETWLKFLFESGVEDGHLVEVATSFIEKSTKTVKDICTCVS